MPHTHFVVILDWNALSDAHKAKYSDDYMPEDYIEEYIQTEFPAPPADHDTGEPAHRINEYSELISKNMYHTCKKGRCKEKAGDKCSKHYPVF
jgi:hypothetical protein